LVNKFAFLPPYQYASNDPVKNIDLDGLEGIISPLIFGTQQPIMRGPVLEAAIRPALEAGTKVAEAGGKVTAAAGTSKFPVETLQNFSRGNKVEAEQLAKGGLEKNFKPIEYLDPKTGEMGKTVPDAFKNGGQSTVEIKNVKSQGLTKQFRLQEKFSNDNGFNPELIINKSAKLSKPLQGSSFIDLPSMGYIA
jgi:hypothetical protein